MDESCSSRSLDFLRALRRPVLVRSPGGYAVQRAHTRIDRPCSTQSTHAAPRRRSHAVHTCTCTCMSVPARLPRAPPRSSAVSVASLARAQTSETRLDGERRRLGDPPLRRRCNRGRRRRASKRRGLSLPCPEGAAPSNCASWSGGQGCWSELSDHAAAPARGAFPSVASDTGMYFVLDHAFVLKRFAVGNCLMQHWFQLGFKQLLGSVPFFVCFPLDHAITCL